MAILDYFQEPNAERVLLVEIERNVSPAKRYYLADSLYITEPTDSPANVIYTNVIGGSGLPEFRRTLNDPFTGNASTSFGNLELVDTTVSFTQNTTKSEETIATPKGAKVFAFLAAPRRLFPRSDAIPLAVGSVERFSGNSEGNYSIEIVDSRQFIANKFLTITQYPLCFGQVRNVQAVLGDPAIRKYFVNQGQIESIDAVYDDGVLLTAGTQYSVNLTEGSFTLVNAPNGTITADVKGVKVGATWFSTTQQIITEILSRAGVTGFTTQFDLPTGIVGYVVRETTDLQTILNDLCSGCGGYWLVDRLGVLKFRRFPTVSGLGQVFTERELIETFSYETEENLFNSINYSYKNNWTKIQPRVGASAAIAAFVQKDAEQASFGSASDPELIYVTSPFIKTYFDVQADAQTVASSIFNIYSVPRKIYSITIPFMNTLDLGSTVTIMTANLEATGVVTEVVDVFDGSYPTQKVKILA